MKLSRFVLFFLVFFSPLAFGTKADWSYGIMESLTAVGLFFMAAAVLRKEESLVAVPGLVPVLIFLGYILFQLVPLPPVVVKFLSPQAFIIHSRALELTGLPDTGGFMTLSVAPKATLFHFFRYATYAAFYVMAVQILKHKRVLQAMGISIAVYGGLLAFSSILQFYLTEDMALWFWYTPENSTVMGPYSNSNHYAGLMEMIFPVVLAMFFFYRPRIGETSFFKGLVEILNQEKANIHILIGMSALLAVVSVFISLSRGGIISTCLAMVVFAALLSRQRSRRRSSMVILGIIIVVALSVGWFGWDHIFEHFSRIRNPDGVLYDARLQFWQDSAGIIKDFMVTGSGAGTFVHVYPPYKTLIDNRVLNHAHNDYIELLCEGGIIGFMLFSFFLGVLFFKTFKMFARRRDAFCVYMYIGSLTGMVSILFHSVTDFNLQIGANGLWFAFLAALAVSGSHTNIRRKSTETRLKVVDMAWKKNSFAAVAGLFLLSMAVFQVSHQAGAFYFNHIRTQVIRADTSDADLAAIESIAKRAAAFDPLFSRPRYFQAVAAVRQGNILKALESFRAAIRLEPLNSWYLKRYGRFAARQNQPDKAETAFELAVKYRPTLPEYMMQYGAWLLDTGRQGRGIEALRRTLELDDTYADQVIRTMLVAGVDRDVMQDAIPKTPGPMFAFAEFLYTTGRQEAGKTLYLEVLDLLSKQAEPKPWYFNRIYAFFIRQKDILHAMSVMETAEQVLPKHAGFKITLGDLYRRQGVLFKAREKYEQALFLEPGNMKARQRLEKLNKS